VPSSRDDASAPRRRYKLYLSLLFSGSKLWHVYFFIILIKRSMILTNGFGYFLISFFSWNRFSVVLFSRE
jgi:hypothetical protein